MSTKAEMQRELDRLHALLDEDMTYRDYEAKVRNGEITVRAVMGEEDSVKACMKNLAFMCLHVLLGEDGVEPPNYRMFEMDVHPRNGFESFTLCVEVVKPGGKSSHQIRRELEAAMS